MVADESELRAMFGDAPCDWLHASVRERRYYTLIVSIALRRGMQLMLRCEREPGAGASVALVDVEAITYKNRAFKSKFVNFDGFHDFIFWTLIDASDMQIGSMAHIRYLHDVGRELMSSLE